MPSPQTILAIQEIKDSVERPYLCGWLSNLGWHQSQRYLIGRYQEASLKVMALLHHDLSPADIREFDELYSALQKHPATWLDTRLNLAKDLWRYVSGLDEWLSREEIRYSSSGRKVQFADNTCSEAFPTRSFRNLTGKHGGPSENLWAPSSWYYTTPVTRTIAYPAWCTTYYSAYPWSPNY